MTSIAHRHRHRRVDHVPVLQNCGPGTQSVYRTGTVGLQVVVEPRTLVSTLLTNAGLPVLPSSTYQPVQTTQLHPALVAAAAGITLVLVAKVLGTPSTVDDGDLHQRIVGGRRALGSWRSGYPELALGRLEQLRDCTAQLIGGTRLNGIARWMQHMQALAAVDAAPAIDPHAAVKALVFNMMVLAFAAPPIVSFRRAPSLEYFRVQGSLEIRHFGHPGGA